MNQNLPSDNIALLVIVVILVTALALTVTTLVTSNPIYAVFGGWLSFGVFVYSSKRSGWF